MRMKQKYAQITVIALLTVVGSFIMDSVTLAQEYPWVRKADMPAGRHGFAVCAVDSLIYVAGGRYTDNLVTEYDPATDSWTTKSSMPTSRMVLSGCAVNGQIYALGGITAAFQPALSTVEQYDPVTDTWTVKSPMPTKRLGLGTSVVDGKIYAIGGMTSGSNFWSGMQSCVEVYDPETDSWSTRTDMPTKRCWFTTSVVDGKIYAIGGALVTKQPLSVVEMYDPETDTWSTKAPMPTKRMGHAAAAVDGIIYVIGGGTENGQPVGGYSVVEAYDPEKDIWIKKADMPVPRASMSAQELEGNIYVIGGISNFADPHLHGEKTVYVYDPLKDLTELVNTCSVNKCFAHAGDDSICIKAKINDPNGVTLFAVIESPDNTPVDSLELFNDGNHNDGNAGDSVYANIWPVNSTDEKQYNLDLTVMRVASDTVTHHMDNLAKFTTIGPIVFEDYTFNPSDTTANPGDEISIKLILKNEGSSASAISVDAEIASQDTFVTYIVNNLWSSFGQIEPGQSKTGSYYYKIKISDVCPDSTLIQFAIDINSNGYKFWSDTFSILVVSAATIINKKENPLRRFILNQNYPNPFNPTTTIEFVIPENSNVTLKLFDILGQNVATLVDDRLQPGEYKIVLNASDLSSGVYFYVLQADRFFQQRKLILIK